MEGTFELGAWLLLTGEAYYFWLKSGVLMVYLIFLVLMFIYLFRQPR